MQILINRIRIRAFHGVMPQEKKVGQDFEVSLKLDIGEFDGSDSIESTVNYAEVISVVKEQMKIASDLIEHVAFRIANAVIERFSRICSVEVTLAKLRPPVEAELESVEVRVSVCR